MKNIVVYSTKSCPYCYMAKDFLSGKKIKFTDVDVGKDQGAAQEMFKKSGQMGVPVIDVGGKIIIGFDKEAIIEALGISE